MPRNTCSRKGKCRGKDKTALWVPKSPTSVCVLVRTAGFSYFRCRGRWGCCSPVFEQPGCSSSVVTGQQHWRERVCSGCSSSSRSGKAFSAVVATPRESPSATTNNRREIFPSDCSNNRRSVHPSPLFRPQQNTKGRNPYLQARFPDARIYMPSAPPNKCSQGWLQGLRGGLKQHMAQVTAGDGMQQAVVCFLKFPFFSQIFNATGSRGQAVICMQHDHTLRHMERHI